MPRITLLMSALGTPVIKLSNPSNVAPPPYAKDLGHEATANTIPALASLGGPKSANWLLIPLTMIMCLCLLRN